MKQVWQTDDGATFDDLEKAQQWEREQSAIKSLSAFLENESCRLDEYDARDLATALIVHYNVTPK